MIFLLTSKINQMKLPVFILLFLFAFDSNAQSCTLFHQMKQGSKTEMTHYDKKGKLASKTSNEVIEILPAGSGYEADIRTKAIDKDGEEIFNGDVKMSCENNVISVSMQHILGPDQLKSFQDMEVKIDETNILYPFDINPSSVLKDGSFKAEIYSGDTKIVTLTFEITDRKVIGKESITTPAGTFDCLKITYNSKFKALFTFLSEVTDWWSPKYGLVKSESMKNGKSQGYSELTKI
jgi:hypothetical protein